MPAAPAAANTCAPSITSVRPASIDIAVAPADFIASMVATPITGTSKRMSWFGLATFTTRDACAGDPPGSLDHLVGPLHRLHRHDGPVLHDDRLTHIESCDGIRNAITEGEILLLILRRAAGCEDPFAGKERAEERRRVHQLDTVITHHVGDRGDQRVGVSRLEAGEYRQKGQVGDDAGKDLRVLDLPGHQGARDPVGLENLDTLAQVAE